MPSVTTTASGRSEGWNQTVTVTRAQTRSPSSPPPAAAWEPLAPGNNVLPGYIESFEIDEETRESIPMRRRGSVAEIAKTATFLLSEDSGYITGQNIRVDGGLTRSI